MEMNFVFYKCEFYYSIYLPSAENCIEVSEAVQWFVLALASLLLAARSFSFLFSY